jgi:alkanesulfonate monooxygenase
MTDIRIRSPQREVEIAWFSALCSDDYEYLGVPDGNLRSNFQHCGDLVRDAVRRCRTFWKKAFENSALLG